MLTALHWPNNMLWRALSVVTAFCAWLFVAHALAQSNIIGGGFYGDVKVSACSMAFDSVASASGTTAGTTFTWTHTPVGTPTAVSVTLQDFPTGLPPSAVTYGGTSMSLGHATTSDANGSFIQIWGLANPPSGAQTVSVTLNTGDAVIGGSVAVTCSNTSAAFDNANGATGTGTAASVALTSVAGEIAVDILGSYSSGSSFTPGGSQTQKWGMLSVGGDRAGGSIQTATGASTTMSWTLGASAVWADVGATFKHQ